MGSGISTKYEKTYFYRSSEAESQSVAESAIEYGTADTHTIESHNDERVMRFCEDMVSRKPHEESSYAQNLANTAQHFEMNENGFFGYPGEGQKVWVIESESPMDSSMVFFSEMGEGGKIGYLSNYHGIKSSLSDGTDVLFRPYPKTEGSPAVEIRINFEKHAHKIHFVQR